MARQRIYPARVVGRRDLVKVWGTHEAARPVHDFLVAYLRERGIAFHRYSSQDGWGREFWQYQVDQRDLIAAQCALPFVRMMQQARFAAGGAE